jgi:hypothetical protein
VDALKLSRLCDAPRLYLECVRLAGKDLAAVELSEGWRFAGRHDAALQADLLRLLHDADQVRVPFLFSGCQSHALFLSK